MKDSLPVPDQLEKQLAKCKSVRDADTYIKSRVKTQEVRLVWKLYYGVAGFGIIGGRGLSGCVVAQDSYMREAGDVSLVHCVASQYCGGWHL